MTSRPYELLVRFAPDGSIGGASIRTITTVNGRDYESDPQPLSGASDPAFTAFANQFAAAVVAQRDQLLLDKSSIESQLATITAERDSLQSQLATITTERNTLFVDLSVAQSDISRLTSERDSITTDRDAKAARIIELESQIDALLHPPGPDLTTRDGVRQYVSNARYVAETGGIYVGEQFISTERDEIGHWFPRFYNALMWLNGDPRIRAGNPDGLYPFKPKNHPPTVLSAEQVLRAYECMAWYINACFAEEAVLYARLDANEPLDVIVTATATAWPSNRFSWEPPA